MAEEKNLGAVKDLTEGSPAKLIFYWQEMSFNNFLDSWIH